MKPVQSLATILCIITAAPAFASDCEDLPPTGQASVEKKYMKIKAESADAATDCYITRRNDAVGEGHYVTVFCRIHFRPRNGGCFVGYTPNENNLNVSKHPGCTSEWAWVKNVGMDTDGDALDPQGKHYTGSVHFDMMKEQYEVKYKVLVGEKKNDAVAEDVYKATLQQICMRKVD